MIGMTQPKERLTVSIEPALLLAAGGAVAAGRAESVSAWVGQAIAAKLASELRLQALNSALADYEAEFGVISDEEMDARIARDRSIAIRVNAKRTRRPAAQSRVRG